MMVLPQPNKCGSQFNLDPLEHGNPTTEWRTPLLWQKDN
jgi:hypothetical protein